MHVRNGKSTMMNDFTKEELEELKHCLYTKASSLLQYTRKHDHPWFKEYDRLMEKIQSMIDNYCEHDNKTTGLNPDLSDYDLAYPDDSIITAFILKNVISELENLIKVNIENVHSRIDRLRDLF